jgi:hypothetical protein
MKTTIEIPDELFRQAKAKAALDGIKLKDLVAEGLRLVMAQPARKKRLRRTKFPIIESKRTDPLLTLEQVKQAMADMEDEEARHYAQFMRR